MSGRCPVNTVLNGEAIARTSLRHQRPGRPLIVVANTPEGFRIEHPELAGNEFQAADVLGRETDTLISVKSAELITGEVVSIGESGIRFSVAKTRSI